MQAKSTPAAISRRDFLRAGAGVTGLLVLSACVPPAAPGAPAAGGAAAGAGGTAPIELEVWTGWTEAMATNIEKILDGYNKSQTKVVAKHVVVPESHDPEAAGRGRGRQPARHRRRLWRQHRLPAGRPEGAAGAGRDRHADQVDTLKKWMAASHLGPGRLRGQVLLRQHVESVLRACFVNTKMCREPQASTPHKPPQNLEELADAWEKLTTYDANGNIDVLGGDFTLVRSGHGPLPRPVRLRRRQEDHRQPSEQRQGAQVDHRLLGAGWASTKLQDFYASLAGPHANARPARTRSSPGLRATFVTGPWQFDTINRYKPEGFEFTVWPLPRPTQPGQEGHVHLWRRLDHPQGLARTRPQPGRSSAR